MWSGDIIHAFRYSTVLEGNGLGLRRLVGETTDSADLILDGIADMMAVLSGCIENSVE